MRKRSSKEAVRLWLSSGRAAEHTARDLGISVFNPYEWGCAGRLTRAAGPHVSKDELEAENERVRRELARITEQRVILKKAEGILSEPPPSGMPGSRR